MALGDNIKRLRTEQSLTQQQLADKLYVSRQTVCRWENGSRCPDLIMAKKLAMELAVSLDELISDEDLKEFEKNGFTFRSDIVKRRKELEEKQKRVIEFIQLIAGIFLAVTLLCRIQLEIPVPRWVILITLCIVIVLFAVRYRISRQLDGLYGKE